MKKLEKTTRLEVIDQTGRILSLNSVEAVGVSMQDNDRTMKVFLQNNSPSEYMDKFEFIISRIIKEKVICNSTIRRVAIEEGLKGDQIVRLLDALYVLTLNKEGLEEYFDK